MTHADHCTSRGPADVALGTGLTTVRIVRFDRVTLAGGLRKDVPGMVGGLGTERTGRVDDRDDLAAIGFVDAGDAAARQTAAAKSSPDSHPARVRHALPAEGLPFRS